MKLKDVILLSLSAALVIVGTHMTITQGITFSYPIFMFAVVLLFWFKYRKTNNMDQEESQPNPAKKKKRK